MPPHTRASRRCARAALLSVLLAAPAFADPNPDKGAALVAALEAVPWGNNPDPRWGKAKWNALLIHQMLGEPLSAEEQAQIAGLPPDIQKQLPGKLSGTAYETLNTALAQWRSQTQATCASNGVGSTQCGQWLWKNDLDTLYAQLNSWSRDGLRQAPPSAAAPPTNSPATQQEDPLLSPQGPAAGPSDAPGGPGNSAGGPGSDTGGPGRSTGGATTNGGSGGGGGGGGSGGASGNGFKEGGAMKDLKHGFDNPADNLSDAKPGGKTLGSLGNAGGANGAAGKAPAGNGGGADAAGFAGTGSAATTANASSCLSGGHCSNAPGVPALGSSGNPPGVKVASLAGTSGFAGGFGNRSSGGGTGGGFARGGFAGGGSDGLPGPLAGPRAAEPPRERATEEEKKKAPKAESDELSEEDKKALSEIQTLLQQAADSGSLDGPALEDALDRITAKDPAMAKVEERAAEILGMAGRELTMAERQEVLALASSLELSEARTARLPPAVENGVPAPSADKALPRWLKLARWLRKSASSPRFLLVAAALAAVALLGLRRLFARPAAPAV
jgi:hypothetical protein